MIAGKGVPLLGEEGWLRHQENAAKPPYEGADGVVSPDNVSTSTFTIMTHPVCAASEASRLFLTGAATLLFQEGNTLSWQFVQTFIERRYSCSNRVAVLNAGIKPAATNPV